VGLLRDYLLALPDDARVEVVAAMKDVREHGLPVARHVRGDLYEVRASHAGREYRILFASEGRRRHILLALEGFEKKTQKTPAYLIDLALARLADWRRRGAT
jgi:phage-related protein